MNSDLIVLIPILLPLIGAFLVWGIGRIKEDAAPIVSTVISGLTLLSVGWIYSVVNKTGAISLKLDIGIPNIPLYFRADSLGLFLSLITCFVWVLASLYAIEYIGKRKILFNVFLLFSLYAMLGINLTGNLYSLLLFFELFSVASAVLVMHEGSKQAIRAGFQYLFMSIVGSVAVIFAVAILWWLTGTTDLTGTGIDGLTDGPMGIALFWLLILGFAIKAGMFPVHVWLPVAHPIAPSPASALLSGVMIKAGAYGMIRIVYGIFGVELVSNAFMIKTLMVLAVITMILGSVLAIAQTEIKRLLAYSSVAQIGYVILGITLLNINGFAGGVLHIFNHALMKGALFLAAGAIIHQTGIRNIKDLKGLGKRMPLTMAAFTMAALSMIGIPPFIGFFSKWLLGLGALDASSLGLITPFYAYAIVGAIVFSGLLNIIYYGPIIMNGWFQDPEGEISPPHAGPQPVLATDGGEEVDDGGHGDGEATKVDQYEPSWLMSVPMLTLAMGTLVFGIYIHLPMRLVENVIGMYLRG